MDVEYKKLDDNWINEFENTDKLYKDYYKDDLYYVQLRVIYINRVNEIEKLKQESFLMSKPNYITREEILEILKKNSIDNNKRYSLLSMLKYNIILEPDNVPLYLNDKFDEEYLSIIKNIDAIPFNKSINMFHDLNDIILIFYEKSAEFKTSDANNTTKKVYLHSLTNHKKTLKKIYKD
jgi:hypothetical protein